MSSASATSACRLNRNNQSKFNQQLSAFLISSSGFALGVTLAWNSSTSDTVRDVFNATGIEMGLVGSIVNVGACGGILILPCVLKSLSRTTVMVSTTPIYLVGWAFICLTDRKIWCLGIGRFLCGFSGGIPCAITPMFVGEIADKNIRVRLLTYFQLFISCGVFYAFLMGHFMYEQDTVWKYSLTSAVSCAPIMFIYILPESSLYYLMNNDRNNAVKSMIWYRGVEKHQEELLEIIDLARSKNFKFKMMKKREVILAILVCHGVTIAHQLSGINPLISNAAMIFENLGSGYLTSSELTIVVAATQILFCLICTTFIDRLGRRILLTVSGISMGISLILLGWYFSVRDNDPEFYEEIYGWMPPTWLALFFASFNLGLGPISWSILGDTLPNEIKMFGIVSATFFSWLLSLIITSTFSEFIVTLGVSQSMWLLGSFCCGGAIFCGVFVRETNNKSLADIQKNFAIDSSKVEIDLNIK